MRLTSLIATLCSLSMLTLVSFKCVARADGLSNPIKVSDDVQVKSFAECARHEGQILKSYPAQCVTKDGKVFVDESKIAEKSCKDLCGDGACQEIVCMAVGCPCPENRQSCAKDCQ